MKQYFYSFRFAFLHLFILLIFFQHTNSSAKTIDADTIHIQILIDSCKAKPDLQCGNNLLKLIQETLTQTPNEKEISFYKKAEIQALRNIGNVYKNSLFDLPKAMEYYQMSRKQSEEIGDKLALAASLL